MDRQQEIELMQGVQERMGERLRRLRSLFMSMPEDKQEAILNYDGEQDVGANK